jgi:hypothetical protein
VKTPKSSNFEDMWSFDYPHLSMKEHREKLHRVEVPIEKGAFRAFQEEECDNCDYILKTSLLRVWEYTKEK